MENSQTFSSEPLDVPASVWYTRDLSPVSKQVYFMLIEIAGKFNTRKHIKVSVSQLAEELNYSTRSITRGLNQLADLKLIEIIKNPGVQNKYRLLKLSEALITYPPDTEGRFIHLI